MCILPQRKGASAPKDRVGGRPVSWVWAEGRTFATTWPVCVGLFLAIIALAWLAMRFYDEPVRRALSRRFLGRKAA